MQKVVFLSKLEHIWKALDTLKYSLSESKKIEKWKLFNVYRDSVIQRFEYTYELSWKYMKFLWKYAEGDIEVRSASQAIKSAFKNWYIDSMKVWFKMMEWRNKTSHEYEEDISDDLYFEIFSYNDEIQKFYELIQLRYGQWYFRFDN